VRKTITIRQAIRDAERRLGQKGFSSPGLDAEILLAFCLGMERTGIFRDMDRPVAPWEMQSFSDLVERRLRGEPVAYIVGRKEFWSLDLKVSPAVLVPRPETEILVQVVLDTARRLGTAAPRILEIGTGSGAISIAVASEWPGAEITVTELSAAALEVARENVKKLLGQESRIAFVQGDLYEGAEGVFDIVCSNPPYISDAEYATLAREVALYEPREALVAGPEGTEFHRRIAEGARDRLKPGGWLVMEMGAEQQAALAGILEETKIFDEIRYRADYAGLNRVVIARKAA
jgi:release factor glutamine methyltransferase